MHNFKDCAIHAVALLAGFSIGIVAVRPVAAADSYYTVVDTDTQTEKKIKLHDNGDGTFSHAAADGLAVSTAVYKYAADRAYSTFTYTTTWTACDLYLVVDGGSASYKVNGGSTAWLTDGQSFHHDFRCRQAAPSLNVNFIQSGTTVTWVMEGQQ